MLVIKINRKALNVVVFLVPALDPTGKTRVVIVRGLPEAIVDAAE